MAPKAAAKGKAAAKPKAEKKEKPEEPEIPKVNQPDQAAFDEKLAGIGSDIEKLQQEKERISKEISGRSGGKDDFFTQKAEIRKELDVVSAEIDALHKQKEQLLGAADAHKAEGREMRDQLNKMKQTIGYGSVQDIDERIATIEFKLHTESVPLKEEKKLIEEIKQLKKNRPKVTGMNSLKESLDSRGPNLDNRAAGMEVKAQIALCMERKKKIHEKLTELNESRKAQLGDMPDLIEKRDGVSKKIGEKIQERNKLRDEFREEQRAYREYQNELRQVRQKKAMEEREARQREWNQKRLEREAEKLDDQPYVQEITLIEQTISFCKGLTQSKDDNQKEEAKEIDHDSRPDGTMVLLSKDKREEEFFFAPTAKGKKGKNKNKEKGSSKPIKHNAETFALFAKLKLDAPITTEDVPDLLEKLEAQLEDYKVKVKEWEEKREEMKRKILEEGILPKGDDDDDKEDGKGADEAKDEE